MKEYRLDAERCSLLAASPSCNFRPSSEQDALNAKIRVILYNLFRLQPSAIATSVSKLPPATQGPLASDFQDWESNMSGCGEGTNSEETQRVKSRSPQLKKDEKGIHTPADKTCGMLQKKPLVLHPNSI